MKREEKKRETEKGKTEKGEVGGGGNYFIVWETSSRENGNLLATSNGVHSINGGDTSLNHFTRVHTL